MMWERWAGPHHISLDGKFRYDTYHTLLTRSFAACRKRANHGEVWQPKSNASPIVWSRDAPDTAAQLHIEARAPDERAHACGKNAPMTGVESVVRTVRASERLLRSLHTWRATNGGRTRWLVHVFAEQLLELVCARTKAQPDAFVGAVDVLREGCLSGARINLRDAI